MKAPHFGHCLALSEIKFPHSLHLMSGMVVDRVLLYYISAKVHIFKSMTILRVASWAGEVSKLPKQVANDTNVIYHSIELVF